MNTRKLALSLFTLLAGLAIAEPSARADPSCSALLQDRIAQSSSTQGWQIEMTIHREDVAFVTYSSGALYNFGSGNLTGYANQLFSDRRTVNNQQPFNASQSDSLYIQLSPSGLLHIHYSPWNFDTDWDMSCQGTVMTKYLPGIGVVTLTFRRLVTIIG
jgi:hypothetical protein